MRGRCFSGQGLERKCDVPSAGDLRGKTGGKKSVYTAACAEKGAREVGGEKG